MVPLHLRSSVDDSNGTHHCGKKEPYVEKLSTTFILNTIRNMWFDGWIKPLSSPTYSRMDTRLKAKGTLPYKRWTRKDCADVFDQSDFGEMRSGAWKEVLFARVFENLRLLEGFGSSFSGYLVIFLIFLTLFLRYFIF
ncbi:hypothetical protein Tco_0782295 [Tanacetum coccineum]